jgi:hypothetical protein
MVLRQCKIQSKIKRLFTTPVRIEAEANDGLRSDARIKFTKMYKTRAFV